MSNRKKTLYIYKTIFKCDYFIFKYCVCIERDVHIFKNTITETFFPFEAITVKHWLLPLFQQ